MPVRTDSSTLPPAASQAAGAGLLLSRPAAGLGCSGPLVGGAAKTPLGLAAGRDGFLYLPMGPAQGARPLLVFLHGAGGDASQADSLLPLADKFGVLVLSIDSRAVTWDLIRGELGPDVAFLDRALQFTFERCAVDAAHLALAGFSDGASYALSLGLANGGLFSHILAFSPGFANPPARRGSPRLFVAHGASDDVLPIGVCSRRIVSRLERTGYGVEYEEFEGGHHMPAGVVTDALGWMLVKNRGSSVG
jgi:phospholipase/carboxylesterase